MPPIIDTPDATIRIAYGTCFLRPRSWPLYGVCRAPFLFPVYGLVTTVMPLLLEVPLVSICPIFFSEGFRFLLLYKILWCSSCCSAPISPSLEPPTCGTGIVALIYVEAEGWRTRRDFDSILRFNPT